MAGANGDQITIGPKAAARLWGVIHGFATSEVRGRAIGMAVGLLALLLAINGLNVLNSYVGRDFMTAIERRDRSGFVRQAFVYTGVFGLSTIAAVIYRFTEERLGLLWRASLTRRLVRIYLDGGLYHRLHTSGAISNPDQRIADDVRSLTSGTLSLVLIFLNGTFTIVAFSGVLWSISRLLFAVAVGYAVLGSLLAVFFGRPLVRLNYDQSDREASFRAELVHVRENADWVLLLRRERHFLARLEKKIEALTGNFRRLIAVNRNLGFFVTGYNYMIQLIPALIVAPLFIRGQAEFGEIPQASMAFAHLVGAFSLVVNQFGQLSSYAAVLARLTALGEAADAVAPLGTPGIVVSEEGRRLVVDRLTLRAPHDGRVLVRDLSFDLAAGTRAVIAGPGDAVAALQRALAGTWPSGEGTIVRPDDLMILPDRPYLPPGTMRELLVPPTASVPPGDDEVWAALRTAGVETAVRRGGGLDVEIDWDSALSLPEQRLVEIARMLLAVPSFVVLTHLDASLGPAGATEARAVLAGRGIGWVALQGDVLEREQLDAVVRLADDGTCTRTAGHAAAG